MKTPSKKTILILSSSFGQGHMATARALESAAISHPELGVQVKIIDFSEEIGKLFNKTSKRMYEINTKHLPALYKWMYVSSDITHTPIRLANLLSYPLRRSHLKKLLEESQPDLIISNYPIWQYIAYQLAKKYFPAIDFVTLVTDSITVHSSWTIPDSDYYIVANEATAESLSTLGVASKKIHALGYPVHESFSHTNLDFSAVKEVLGLPRKRKLILFSASALRTGYVKRVVRAITSQYPEYSLVVVTGRDEVLHNSLKNDFPWQSPHSILVGWTKEMPQLIMASELIITKAGGSTVMECIAAGKPLIINKIIPGQEEGNAELVEKYQLGAVARKSTDILREMEDIFSNYDDYQKRLLSLAKPDAAQIIIQYLSKQLKNP